MLKQGIQIKFSEYYILLDYDKVLFFRDVYFVYPVSNKAGL